MNGSKSKAELAREYGISVSGLRYWLKGYPEQQLKAMGINKYAKVLPPKAVEFIYEHFGKP